VTVLNLSVVIPVLNEEQNLAVLCGDLVPVLEATGSEFEVIFVDDGSTDQSAARISALHARDPRVKLVSLSRNFGHQHALTAGMDYARGDAVIMMDADMQHPPSLVPELLRRWKEGYEIVYTVRRNTRDAGPFKRATAALFYRLFRSLTGLNVPANTADFRLLDRKVVEAFRHIRERTRFLRGLTGWAGYRCFAVAYEAPARHRGKTKYNASRMAQFAINGLVSFSAAPLYAAIYVGLLLALVGFFYLLYVFYARFVSGNVVPGWTSVIVLVSFIGGIQLILMGFIGVYVGKIYEESKQRPLYLVREALGFEGKSEATGLAAAPVPKS
jgi:polyisoprenyl-phosphate glycosyltransferase